MYGLVTPTGTKGSFSPGWCHQPRQKGHPLVWVGVTNRDKRVGPFIPDGATNRDKRGSFCPGWCLQPGQKTSVPPGPANRWTRDKSHILSRAQRQPGQMAWNKGMFCNSVCLTPQGINHANINNCKISQVYMTEPYKRELVANPYLLSEARPTTRQLLHLTPLA